MKKYFLLLSLTVFIIPSLAFASWWNPISWFQKNTTTNTQVQVTSVPTPPSTPTTVVTPPPVPSDYKTYINKTLGFTFEYPKNWIIYDNSSVSFVLVSAYSCPINSQTIKDKTCMPLMFIVSATAKNTEPPNPSYIGWTKTKIKIIGLDADKITDPKLDHTDIYFVQGANYYQISMDEKNNPKAQADPILNHILSSFAFTTASGTNTALVIPPAQIVRARDTTRLQDVRKIEQSLEAYYADNSSYPNTLQDLNPKYINPLPTAQEPADGSCTESQNTYVYNQTSSGQNYTLTFCLGSISGGFKAGLHTASLGGIN